MPNNFCSLPGCALIAISRCSGCHGSYYCTREHQVKHWKAHKVECKVRKSGQDNKAYIKSPPEPKGSELRSCRCMFCGDEIECGSESDAIDHMKVCPALQEQLNDDNQFTLPESMK